MSGISRNYAISTGIVALLGFGFYLVFNLWLAQVGTPVFDVPRRASSATEIKVRRVIDEFRNSQQPILILEMSTLLPKSAEIVCFQFGRETQANFEHAVGKSISDYYQIMHLGEAWWFFYSDGTYEPVYLGPSSDRLYHIGSNFPLRKCAGAAQLELRHRTSYSSDSKEIAEVTYVFREGEQ